MGEMAEWLKALAWKLTPLARADAHRIIPTHFRSTTSRSNDLLQCGGSDGSVQRGEELFEVTLRHVQMRRDADRRPSLTDEHLLGTERSDEIPVESSRQARADNVRRALR